MWNWLTIALGLSQLRINLTEFAGTWYQMSGECVMQIKYDIGDVDTTTFIVGVEGFERAGIARAESNIIYHTFNEGIPSLTFDVIKKTDNYFLVDVLGDLVAYTKNPKKFWFNDKWELERHVNPLFLEDKLVFSERCTSLWLR